MKALYFDCFSGISGDMTLGALLDLGLDQEAFLAEMAKVHVDGFEIKIGRVNKNGIDAMDVDVILAEEEHHHHHDHDDECCCGHDHDHEHHHHDDACGCGHEHHHHHHADEVFTSWGQETVKTFTKEQIEGILKKLSEDTAYGMVLRAKGMVAGADGQWIYFDMVPEEYEVRDGAPEFTGRICVIGSKLAEDKLAELFGL